jgi:homoserine kinase
VSNSRFRVSVPATTANLGPGFDTIGVALERRIFADVEVLPPDAQTEFAFAETAYKPTHDGLRNEITRGITRVLGRNASPLRISVENNIPLGKGMGGSAAGAVLGVTIGAELAEKRPEEATLAQLITEIEGHPDNGIPAFLGGIVIAAQNPDRPPSYARFDPPPGLYAVVVVPDFAMPTAEARAVLPTSYSRRDAVYNIQHASLLAAALASGKFDLLRSAMADRIHQPYRANFVPGLLEMIALEMPGLFGVALSGAGPSVIAFVDRLDHPVGAALQEIFRLHGIGSVVLPHSIATSGALVEAPHPTETSWRNA